MKNKSIIITASAVLGLALIYFAFLFPWNQTTTGSIPQPNLAKSELKNLPVASDTKRVDLKMPTFSNPTNITNPLFPVKMPQVLLTGHIDGEPQQVTYSLLPGTRKIKWNGKEIETVIIQYNAYLDRRIIEVATDWYAQDDNGAVWYFGEDVFNYKDGQVENTDGTWLAERDGPAALIMPANPKVGDVFRVENIPGKAFEEITVTKINTTISGAFGPITGAMMVDQLHMDGTHSDKSFAPGIGEYVTATPSDLEVVALALPADALNTPPPSELTMITKNALIIYDVAKEKNWIEAKAKLAEMKALWNNLKARGNISNLLVAQMDRALIKLAGDVLSPAVVAEDIAGARLNALDTALASLDIELRYRSLEEIDRERLQVYAKKAIVDSEAKEAGFVLSDVIALQMIEARLVKALGSKDAVLKSLIKELHDAAGKDDFKGATGAAQKVVDFR